MEQLLEPVSVDEQIRELVFQYLRSVGYFDDLTPAPKGTTNIGKLTCRDDRSFAHEFNYLQELNQAPDQDPSQPSPKVGVIPYGIYGGVMRFSPYCPEMSDTKLGFKLSSNRIHCETLTEAIRIGVVVRGNRLLKAGGHGLQCGWANGLGIGVYQNTRLIMDGRTRLKARANRERWVPGGEYQIFPAYHVKREGSKHNGRTYFLNRQHDLALRYPMEQVMETMTDRRLLELHAPHMLRACSLD